MRRLLLAAVACAIAMMALAAPSAPAQTIGGCELDGTASFAPGLNTEAKDFSYSFNGVLDGCQSSDSGAPTSGTVSAGEIVTIDGVEFQEPVPAGNGSCLSSTTAGTAIVTWADGTQTVVDYSTTGVTAAVHLEGSVADSVTLQSVDGTTSTTVDTTRYAGASALGLLEFSPPDPTACNTPEGVLSAGISGFVGLGSQ